MFLLLEGDVVIQKRLGSFNTEEECIFKQYELMPYLEDKTEGLQCWKLNNAAIAVITGDEIKQHQSELDQTI